MASGTGPIGTLTQVNKYLAKREPGNENLAVLIKLMHAFVGDNDDPMKSPNFASQKADDYSQLIKFMDTETCLRNEQLALLSLRIMKILSRKEQNRNTLNKPCLVVLTRFLKEPLTAKIATECASVMLNACYEKQNVEMVVIAGALIPLCSFLQADEPELQASCAGAIQSICFQELGRKFMRDLDGISDIVRLLEHPNLKVRTRSVGAVHNLSSDAEAIKQIRLSDGIPPLVRALKAPEPAISGSAAGALQNMSREVQSREIIRGLGAVPPLADLVCGADVQAQVCAVGALLNILGPDIGNDDPKHPQRMAFKSILTSCLAMGMISDCMDEFASELNVKRSAVE